MNCLSSLKEPNANAKEPATAKKYGNHNVTDRWHLMLTKAKEQLCKKQQHTGILVTRDSTADDVKHITVTAAKLATCT